MLGHLAETFEQPREQNRTIEDYLRGVPRWCTGCGDNGILTALQRLCRDEELPPEKLVFVVWS